MIVTRGTSRGHIFALFPLVILLAVLLVGAAAGPARAVQPGTGGLRATAAADSVGFPSGITRRLEIYMAHTDRDSAAVQLGGFFSGIVYRDADGGGGSEIVWQRSTDSYVGPGGHRYSRFRNNGNNMCLSHASGVLLTESCSWSNNKQWWAAETINTYPCVGPNCRSWDVLMNWDQPGQAVTLNDTLLVLAPREGYYGAVEQRRFSWRVV